MATIHTYHLSAPAATTPIVTPAMQTKPHLVEMLLLLADAAVAAAAAAAAAARMPGHGDKQMLPSPRHNHAKHIVMYTHKKLNGTPLLRSHHGNNTTRPTPGNECMQNK